jgi:hypothetical protein
MTLHLQNADVYFFISKKVQVVLLWLSQRQVLDLLLSVKIIVSVKVKQLLYLLNVCHFTSKYSSNENLGNRQEGKI